MPAMLAQFFLVVMNDLVSIGDMLQVTILATINHRMPGHTPGNKGDWPGLDWLGMPLT
jgi:hypothetical protein